MSIQARDSGIFRRLLPVIGAVVLVIALALLLAWISNRYTNVDGWYVFLILLLVSSGIMLGCGLLIKRDEGLIFPSWLSWLILAAALLRLGIGVLWFVGLPNWGYGSPVEQAGYIMSDAHARDSAAWQLAESGDSLWTAFGEFRNVDQYGGMLFLSAVVYRYMGGAIHQPLQIVVLAAGISSLTILFPWAFARRLLDMKVALIAAWIVAVFPDAIILGSSQMREAILMTLIAAALYGLVIYVQERKPSRLLWIFIPLVVMLPLSPPIAGVFLVMYIIMAFSIGGWGMVKQPRFWLILLGTAVVAVIGVWLAWERIAPEGISNPFALVSWWFRETARWQAYFVKRSSPLIRRIINTTPDWVNTPILLGYGILQPFLPGAFLDQGIPIWKGIAIWRAIGWTLMLPFLLVSPFVLWNEKAKRRLATGLIVVVWMGILMAALRSGGDLWDNPRYRVVFLSLQALLAAWVLIVQRSSDSPWLKRGIIGLGIILLWFIPWDLQRSSIINWPIESVFGTLALGVISALIIFLGAYLWGIRRN